MLAQSRSLLRGELANERIRHRVQEVQRRRHVDVGREPVVGHRQPAINRQARNFHRFGKAAYARQVDLHDVDLAAVHQLDV